MDYYKILTEKLRVEYWIHMTEGETKYRVKKKILKIEQKKF